MENINRFDNMNENIIIQQETLQLKKTYEIGRENIGNIYRIPVNR